MILSHVLQQLAKVILNYHAAVLFASVKNIRTCQPQISDSGASSTSKSAKADGMHYSNKVYLFAVARDIRDFCCNPFSPLTSCIAGTMNDFLKVSAVGIIHNFHNDWFQIKWGTPFQTHNS